MSPRFLSDVSRLPFGNFVVPSPPKIRGRPTQGGSADGFCGLSHPGLPHIYTDMEKWKQILAIILKILIAILSVIGGGGQIAQNF